MADTSAAPPPDRTEVGSYFVANYPPFSVWTRGRGRARGAAGARSAAGRRRAARPVPAHPVLPEALPLLLLPRLHRQERAGRRALPRRAGARVGAATRRMPAIAGPAARLRLLRRRHAVVPVDRSAPAASSTVLTAATPWTRAEEITFECEPGTLTENKLAAIREHRRHAAEPRRRELRRSHPRAQRPRPPVAGDRPGLPVRARSLDFPQINIDLIAGMLGETDDELAALRREDAGAAARQRHHLPDGAAVQHDDQQRPAASGTRPVQRAGGRLGDQAALGARGVRGARSGRLHVAQRLHRSSRIRRAAAFVYRDRLWQGADMVGPRRRLVRPCQRRARPEPRHLGSLHGGDRCAASLPLGRAYRPTRRGAADPRAGAATQARGDPAGRISPASTASTSCSASAISSRSLRASGDCRCAVAADLVDAVARRGCSHIDSLLPRSSCPNIGHSLHLNLLLRP